MRPPRNGSHDVRGRFWARPEGRQTRFARRAAGGSVDRSLLRLSSAAGAPENGNREVPWFATARAASVPVVIV